ncbi:HEAT repeat domain-containing protein [Thermoflexus sp.]|uniref:HEAT repeat domain-containing protein n=1 Tax=Thermoflexus sp. TaxID=1969742 RepID=UPI0025DE97EE|nr:HEAT repeat domain-containing protein [Thermoflexus sp.]MCS6962673.1 HEAT repeat domain-containing protein [Thermoflexus sp.]MCX7690045.1 HEAT repeat domain-containing protein [Thermoflexus sp.]MDW8185923.1 HEAT repeat domain-containing protein [Anaerolineae bacterium]
MESITRFCPNCWAELPAEAREICPTCGAPLKEEGDFFEKLLRALWHPERTRATLAATLLGQLGDLRAVPSLIEAALHARDFGVQEAAVRSLGQLQDPRAIPALALLLRMEAPLPVRLAAVEALGAFHDPRAREALRGALNDPSEAVRAAARAAWRTTALEEASHHVKG